jgi:hypothetical protein
MSEGAWPQRQLQLCLVYVKLIYNHVNPYGLFLLNMNERLLSGEEAAGQSPQRSWTLLIGLRTAVYPISGCPWYQLRLLYPQQEEYQAGDVE